MGNLGRPLFATANAVANIAISHRFGYLSRRRAAEAPTVENTGATADSRSEIDLQRPDLRRLFSRRGPVANVGLLRQNGFSLRDVPAANRINFCSVIC